jgi:hypothetical protein
MTIAAVAVPYARKIYAKEKKNGMKKKGEKITWQDVTVISRLRHELLV